jgi:hypothetical protein
MSAIGIFTRIFWSVAKKCLNYGPFQICTVHKCGFQAAELYANQYVLCCYEIVNNYIHINVSCFLDYIEIFIQQKIIFLKWPLCSRIVKMIGWALNTVVQYILVPLCVQIWSAASDCTVYKIRTDPEMETNVQKQNKTKYWLLVRTRLKHREVT